MERSAKKSILNIKPYVPGKPIEEVQRELGLRDVIKLASNESPYPPSPKVLQAVSKAAKELNRYPDGDCYYLRQELARHLNVKRDQLIFGNGSDELIVMAVRTFVGEGDAVVMAQPSFLIYQIASKIAGAKIHAVPLKGFQYDLLGMLKVVNKKTKIVFLGNPDNPAGTYLKEKDVRAFVKNVPETTLVFIDEAYFEFVRARDYGNSIKLIKTFPNVIVTRTFSKMYGLAGLRIGYGIADKTLINLLNRIREPFNINSLAQAGALACLKDKAYYRKISQKIEQQRRLLYKGLKHLGLAYQESCTNFILIDVKSDAASVAGQLMRKGVIVRDMSFWGLNRFIRITIGKEKENKKLLRVLKEITL